MRSGLRSIVRQRSFNGELSTRASKGVHAFRARTRPPCARRATARVVAGAKPRKCGAEKAQGSCNGSPMSGAFPPRRRREESSMSRNPRHLAALAVVAGLVSASPAWAWHIAGQVFCDRNGDDAIDGSDTTLDGVGVLISALTNAPGSTFPATTGSGNGSYTVSLPNHDDDYRVELTGVGLPAGATVVVPSSGAYGVPPVPAVHLQADAFDATANFLLSGCV